MNSDKKLKVVILSHGGCEYLIDLLMANDRIDVARVCVEVPKEKARTISDKLKRSIKYDGSVATIKKFGATVFGRATVGKTDLQAAQGSRLALVEFCESRGIKSTTVENYHSAEFKELFREDRADLGVLYGTNIIRKAVFSIPRLGSINIHQGLAPLYRGGPTVFWELFNDEDSIGITVHFVAPKVDTGDIVAQRSISFSYDYGRYGIEFERFLEDTRATLQKPSAELMAEAVDAIACGTEERTAQDISIGKRYRIPTYKEKRELIRRLRNRIGRQQGA